VGLDRVNESTKVGDQGLRCGLPLVLRRGKTRNRNKKEQAANSQDMAHLTSFESEENPTMRSNAQHKRGGRLGLHRRRHDVFMAGLTFDTSGGAKGAKRPLGRPLEGGVRPHALHGSSTACPVQTQDSKQLFPQSMPSL